MKKVIVLNPNYQVTKNDIRYRPRQPLSLLHIVSILENEFGLNVAFYDLNHESIDYNQARGCDYLITTSTPLDRWETPYYNYNPPLNLIKEIKSRNKDLISILTGAHGSLTPEILLNECEQLDIIVRGEPENIIRSLFSKDLECVEGVSYRKEGRIIHNEDNKEPVDLDQLPFPAYDRIDFSNYKFNNRDLLPNPFSIIESSRDCPHKCIFCNKIMHGGKYRYRETDNVISELQLLISKYGVQSVYFQDLEFTLNKPRVMELCERMIESKLEINWGCAARCNDVDKTLLVLMKRAGCKFISFGVESLSDTILREIKKGLSYNDIKRTKRLCDAVGLKFNSFTATGFPKESKKTTITSIIRSILSGVNYKAKKARVRPYPGTKLWEMAVESGMVDEKCNPWKELCKIEGRVGNSGHYDRGQMIAGLIKVQKLYLKRNGVL